LYSQLLPPFGVGSVTVFDPTLLSASPSQKPAGGFPAQASSVSLSPAGIELDQTTWPRERIPRPIARELLPGETAALAASIEPLEHQAMRGVFEAGERAAVVSHAKVIEVTA